MTPILEANQVTHSIGGASVLGPVDLSVASGEIVALVGPNGAGKSTLLGVLSGDLGTGQNVSVNGRAITGIPTRELSRLRAVLPQDSSVSFPFRVREVVAMGRSPWRRTEAANDDELIIARAMSECDVTHLADRTITKLSGGERARVGLARVLAQATPLLLLDEPTAALDIHHQERVFALLRRSCASGTAAVVVVHDLTLAAAYADRIVVLANGQVAVDGQPRKALTPQVLSDVYDHEITVVDHPDTRQPLVTPVR